MRRVLQASPYLCVVVAVGLFAKGWVEASQPVVDPSTWLRFDAESKTFGILPARTVFHIKFTATNTGPRPLHIMGSRGNCSEQGCVHPLPRTYVIPPGSTQELVLKVGLSRPGDFSNELTLFTDCPGRPTLPLRVTGLVEPAADPVGVQYLDGSLGE